MLCSAISLSLSLFLSLSLSLSLECNTLDIRHATGRKRRSTRSRASQRLRRGPQRMPPGEVHLDRVSNRVLELPRRRKGAQLALLSLSESERKTSRSAPAEVGQGRNQKNGEASLLAIQHSIAAQATCEESETSSTEQPALERRVCFGLTRRVVLASGLRPHPPLHNRSLFRTYIVNR